MIPSCSPLWFQARARACAQLQVSQSFTCALHSREAAAAARVTSKMSAAHLPQGSSPPRPHQRPERLCRRHPAAAAPPVEGALGLGASEAWWLGEPARFDAHSLDRTHRAARRRA